MKNEKAMGEALKRIAKECQNDDIEIQMNMDKERILRQKSFWSSWISNAGPIKCGWWRKAEK